MKLKSLIGNIEGGSTKTAAVQTRGSNIMAAINDALEQTENAKTASAHSAIEDLEKMAAEVASSHRGGEVEHAEKIGAAMADSFVRQIAAYEAASEKIAMEKAAEMNVTADELQLVRTARVDPRGFLAKVAEEAEYQDYQNEKVAAEIWENTTQETVRAIHKTAMDHYAVGYATMLDTLSEKQAAGPMPKLTGAGLGALYGGGAGAALGGLGGAIHGAATADEGERLQAALSGAGTGALYGGGAGALLGGGAGAYGAHDLLERGIAPEAVQQMLIDAAKSPVSAARGQLYMPPKQTG